MVKNIQKMKTGLLEYKKSLPHGAIKSIAKETGIGHSTVSRILSGRFSIANPNVEKVCKYAGVPISDGVNSGSFQHITEQLLELWDGSAEMELALLELIKGLKHLRKIA